VTSGLTVACLSALLEVAPGPHPAQGLACAVRARASKTEVMAGEVFTVELSAQGPTGAEFVFPSAAGDEQVELWSATATKPPEPGRWQYQAMALAVGETQVPPVPVGCRLRDGSSVEVKTEPIPLRLVSVLPKDAREHKLADVRPPVPLAIGAPFWIVLGSIFVGLGGLIAWLWRRRRRTSAASVRLAPVVPPGDEARAALAGLTAAGLLDNRDYRGFYIRLIEIAKRYLERRLDAPVLDMTTTEAVAFLRAHPQAESVAVAARELMVAGDQIKFAKGDGIGAEAERHLRAVGVLVAALEAKVAPAAKEAGS
jgi:hypothetical protein